MRTKPNFLPWHEKELGSNPSDCPAQLIERCSYQFRTDTCPLLSLNQALHESWSFQSQSKEKAEGKAEFCFPSDAEDFWDNFPPVTWQKFIGSFLRNLLFKLFKFRLTSRCGRKQKTSASLINMLMLWLQECAECPFGSGLRAQHEVAMETWGGH